MKYIRRVSDCLIAVCDVRVVNDLIFCGCVRRHKLILGVILQNYFPFTQFLNIAFDGARAIPIPAIPTPNISGLYCECYLNPAEKY